MCFSWHTWREWHSIMHFPTWLFSPKSIPNYGALSKIEIINFYFMFFQTITSVQFSSVAQSYPTLCDPMNHSMPGFPVQNQLLEFTQTHVHRVGDAIQPCHPLSPPSPALNLSQHHALFQWVSSSHQVAKVLELRLQHQSLQRILRIDFL